MFVYKVKWYEDENALTETNGFVSGEKFSQAMSTLVEYFDEQAIEEITLSFINDYNILYCEDENVIKKIVEDNVL